MDQYDNQSTQSDPGSVLGMVVAGPIGAVVGAGLAVAATQPNAQPFPLMQRGRHSIVNVELPRNGILIKICDEICVFVFVCACVILGFLKGSDRTTIYSILMSAGRPISRAKQTSRHQDTQ